jgi:hypothetical protein
MSLQATTRQDAPNDVGCEDLPEWDFRRRSVPFVFVCARPGRASAVGSPETDRATAFLRVYQDAARLAQPVSVTARIADTSDRIVLDQVTAITAERFTGNRSADYRLELPVERLEPGEYLLTIEAAQGQNTARRGVRFTAR